MEIQDPSNPGPGSNPSSVNQASHPQGQQRMSTTTSFQNSLSDVPLRGSWHRRAHSEVHFRLPDDLDLSDPFDGRSPSFEELGSEDDIFCTYMDMDKLGSMPDDGSSAPKFNNAGESGGGSVVQRENGGSGGGEEKSMRPRHRHSNSMDGSSMLQSVEAKKAMAPDKLAELWTVDPKRAKRILANRQSASRSKERKARYIIELERKVQTLHTEATTLSAQLTLFQRDTSGLTTENTDLKLRLQSIEQQAHLRDALNEALKKEVERLKVATGEVLSHADNFSLGMSQVPFTHSSFFPNQLQPGSGGPQNMQMPQFHPFQSNMPNSNQQMLTAAHSHACSDMLQQDPLGQFQGLDINSRDYHLVKNEGPSIPASESITRF